MLNDVYCALVEDQQRGLLFVDGKLITCLDAGRYGFWNVEKQVAENNPVLIKLKELDALERISERKSHSVP